ncbi:class I SAM-dependent RNA methyltransferase [Micrococcoides hystricis]|uniref:Class I SAM-dependent RNA methyltransferase n=1 Tax=Micrococcoides hystricis TaxID=1572761 RepID=A0ABV6P6Y0_9MICC
MSENNLPRVRVELGPMAHGGHCVARHEGRVIFVRHGIPGEVVTVALTDAGEKSRFWRGDVIQVHRASEHRRTHFWLAADSLKTHAARNLPVGGAEYGHIHLPHQRRLKNQVFRDTLNRIGKLQVEAYVEELPDEDPQGLGWRTRSSFAIGPTGVMGMHPHRSNRISAVKNFPLAHPRINELKLWTLPLRGAQRIHAATSAEGENLVVLEWLHRITRSTTEVVKQQLDSYAEQLHPVLSELPNLNVALLMVSDPKHPSRRQLLTLTENTALTETATIDGTDYSWQVSADGFWQIHRNAPATLATAMLEMLQPEAGQHVADLYAGAGLFTAVLATAVGETGRVDSVEASPITSADAATNFAHQPQVQVTRAMVETFLKRAKTSWDAIVLDPPRAGAGPEVIAALVAKDIPKICYVSCDPASFARDAADLVQAGYSLEEVRVFDMYPNTHHMESVSLFTRKVV